MITKRFKPVGGLRMEKILSVVPILLAYLWATVLTEGAAVDSSYFLFQPPYGGRRPQESLADKRSDIEGAPSGSNSITPAETLWVGSHKINWSPLPFLLKFSNPGSYPLAKPQQIQQAQARKYDPFGAPPTKEPYQFQKPTPAFHINHHQHQQQNNNKFTFPSFSNLFSPRSQPPPRPQHQLYQFHPYPKLEQRVSSQLGQSTPGLVSSVPISSLRNNEPITSSSSTPSPIFVSTSASILVSPPGTVRAMSTPGTSLKPIVDRLKKMTQWSQKKQRKLVKKEGKSGAGSSTTVDPILERRIRLKNRLNMKAKPHKHNIEAIILSDDNEEDEIVGGSSTETQPKYILKKKRSKGKTGTTSMSIESDEDKGAFPSNDLVIIHPTNAEYLNEPAVQQQPTFNKKYEIEMRRKDKKMGLFKTQITKKLPPAPVTFKFGPEDAKISPYL